jgi:DNA-binding XRE family transcriptional regulator
MGKPQIIKTEAGEELVVLSRRDYEALAARGGDGEAEDAVTARILAETSGEVAIPEAVWQEIEAARSPIGPLRRWRGLTQAGLAAAAGISQGYLSALEGGRKRGDVDTLLAIAAALGVGLDAVTG